jgi:6-phospho-3-hexuloisomerase
VLIASASGTTSSLLDIVSKARSLGARVLSLTGGHDTPLAARSDTSMTVPAALSSGQPGTQPLGTLFEQSLALICDAMVVDLMVRMDVSTASMRTRHANIE